MEISADELLKKIQELEVGHAQLKQEMSRLRPVDDGGVRRSDRARSQSVSPQRMMPPLQRPKGGGLEGAAPAWGRVSGSFGHPSRMHRESRSTIRSGDSAVNIGLSERQCLNILQSMGQSVHIFDPECRIIYWLAIILHSSLMLFLLFVHKHAFLGSFLYPLTISFVQYV